MSVTMEQVRALIDPMEPNYPMAAAIGPEALPHLQHLVTTGDPLLASKATYLAGLIFDAQSFHVIRKAATSAEPSVRVAAAAAAANLVGGSGKSILKGLLRDKDVGVVRIALKSLKPIHADDELYTELVRLKKEKRDSIIDVEYEAAVSRVRGKR